MSQACWRRDARCEGGESLDVFSDTNLFGRGNSIIDGFQVRKIDDLTITAVNVNYRLNKLLSFFVSAADKERFKLSPI